MFYPLTTSKGLISTQIAMPFNHNLPVQAQVPPLIVLPSEHNLHVHALVPPWMGCLAL